MAHFHHDHHHHDHSHDDDSEESDPEDIDGRPPNSPTGYPPRSSNPRPHAAHGIPPSGYPPLAQHGNSGQVLHHPDYYPPAQYMERGSGYNPPPAYGRAGAPPPPYETHPGYQPRGGANTYDADRGYPPPPGSSLYNPNHQGYMPQHLPAGAVLYPPPNHSFPGGPPEVYPPPGRTIDAAAGFPPLPYSPTRAEQRPPPAEYPPMQQPPANENVAFPPLPYDANAGYPPPRPSVQVGPFPEGAIPYSAAASGGYPPPPPQGQRFRSKIWTGFQSSGQIWRSAFGGCQDYWAAFLFVTHFWAVTGICIYLGVKGIRKTNHNNAIQAHDTVQHFLLNNSLNSSMAPSPAIKRPPAGTYSIWDWAPQLATAAGSALVFASIWQTLMRLFPKTMIYICLVTGSVATGLLGIILLSTGNVRGLVGLVFLVAALFQALFVQLVRNRIPFAAIILSKVLLVTARYPGLYFVSYCAVFLAACWTAIWIFGATGALSLPYGGYYVALLIISLAWSIEVLRNIVNVTVAGTVGTFYFQEHAMPRHPTLRALIRACTISFGSICVGSLFVAIVQTLHAIAQCIANEQRGHEFLFSCVNCFLGILDNLIQYFNKWAFVQVAVHGKNFVRAARDTWDLFRTQRVDILINDDLTGVVLFTSCVVGGVFTALVGGCWTFATHRGLTVDISIISFFIGFLLMYLNMVVPESGVAAYYVCFAEDPKVLENNEPPLYQYMLERKMYLEQQIQSS